MPLSPPRWKRQMTRITDLLWRPNETTQARHLAWWGCSASSVLASSSSPGLSRWVKTVGDVGLSPGGEQLTPSEGGLEKVQGEDIYRVVGKAKWNQHWLASVPGQGPMMRSPCQAWEGKGTGTPREWQRDRGCVAFGRRTTVSSLVFTHAAPPALKALPSSPRLGTLNAQHSLI